LIVIVHQPLNQI